MADGLSRVQALLCCCFFRQNSACGSKADSGMYFTHQDATDDFQLDEIIRPSVHGTASTVPPLRHACFIFTREGL